MASKKNRTKKPTQPVCAKKPSEAVLTAGDGYLPANFTLHPLANVSFEQSYKPEILSEAIKNNVSAAILASYGLRGANVALQISSLSQRGLLVHFQEHQYELVKTANGIIKAMTRGANGQIHEIGAVDVFGTCLNGLARSGAVVVAVAHLISSADISKRLGEVQNGIDKLLEYRQIDIAASIKTEYEALREELGRSERRIQEIIEIRKKFRENRHRLFGEVVHEDERIQSVLKSYCSKPKILRIKDKSLVETEAKKGMSIIASRIKQGLYCLQMENIAALYSEDMESQNEFNIEAGLQLERIALRLSKWEYLESSIPSNLPNSMRSVADFLEPKSEYWIHRPVSLSILSISDLWRANELESLS